MMKKVRLPQPASLDLDRFDRALVFVPHPDDEAIGCGGLLAALTKKGVAVKAVLVSDGSGGGSLPEGTAALREGEFLRSLETLGVKDFELLRLLDGGLEMVTDLPQTIASHIDDYKPDIVIAPWYLDMHPDHSAIGYAVKRCADDGVVDALFYEVWSPLECTHILDISAVLSVKTEAIAAHKTALKYGNYSDGIVGLAQYRGLYLPFEGELKYAEAYNFYPKNDGWLKKIWKR
jgi:N-acetylglucosamine malate deacetylase 1